MITCSILRLETSFGNILIDLKGQERVDEIRKVCEQISIRSVSGIEEIRQEFFEKFPNATEVESFASTLEPEIFRI